MDGFGNGWQRMGWTGYSDDTTMNEAGWIQLDRLFSELPTRYGPAFESTHGISFTHMHN